MHTTSVPTLPMQVPAAVGRFLGPLLHAEANQRAVVSPQPAQGRAGGAASDAAGTSGGLAGMAQPQGTSSARVASRDAVEQLTAMGFSEAAARYNFLRGKDCLQNAVHDTVLELCSLAHLLFTELCGVLNRSALERTNNNVQEAALLL